MEAKDNKVACCPASAWGGIENQDDNADSYNGIDKSIGTVEVPVYFTECPTASNKAIVIFPDV